MSWQDDEQVACEDEKIIREFLQSVRGEAWNEVPYRFMDVDIAWLDESGYLPIPQEVQDAYERTRCDSQHYDRYERDYAMWSTAPVFDLLGRTPQHGDLR
jgi:hypothetical protein